MGYSFVANDNLKIFANSYIRNRRNFRITRPYQGQKAYKARTDSAECHMYSNNGLWKIFEKRCQNFKDRKLKKTIIYKYLSIRDVF